MTGPQEPPVLIVPAAQQRARLDQFVAAALAPEYSRARIARMIKAGLIKINGHPSRAATPVHEGDRIEVDQPPNLPVAEPREAVAPPISLLYADEELIVVNKPAGLTVHQAPGHTGPTLVDGLLTRFPELAAMAEPDGVMRPGIVHRLDKDTSGVMAIARTPFARAALSRQFKDRTVRKFYLAIVVGTMAAARRTIDRPIGRHPTERKRMSVRSRTPRAAVSHVTVLCRLDDVSVLGVRPETGRTHQIRVHLASIGHPCLNDPVYGRRSVDALSGRQALHAFRLELDHPRGGHRLAFEAPLADDLDQYLADRKVSGLNEPISVWIEEEGTVGRGSIR